MPLQTQFSLSLELAKVFPIREAAITGAEQFVKLARSLKMHGSDFLVEEDLAVIFGRGRIEPSLEKDFRDAVKTGSLQPLHSDSSIFLDSGPGATGGRALRERPYMSSVIQLSFLVWMHEVTTLAAALVESMLERYKSKVQGATPSPDYEGILKTLQACSSQTSQYRWDDLVSCIENRFPKSAKWFCVSNSPLRALPRNLLSGAMDFMYMVQSLPEDRIIMIENQAGLIPVVIWAHNILGLNVLIKNSPDSDVTFGCKGDPQVIIEWSTTLLPAEAFSTRFSVVKDETLPASPTTIYLLDANMHVVLQNEPKENETTEIDGRERHRLKGYGTTFLRRKFNIKAFMADDDPIFAETANLIVAFAVLLTHSFQRVSSMNDEDFNNAPDQFLISTEYWRLFSSSTVFFQGIKLDKKKISQYLDRLNGNNVEDMAIPTSTRDYLEKCEGTNFEALKNEFILNFVKRLALMILSLAQVINIESCADIPLCLYTGWVDFIMLRDGKHLRRQRIPPTYFFNLIDKMMRIDTKGQKLEDHKSGTILTCHQGWSLFYSSIGDYDPGDIDSELLCIKQGVPTNTQTGERKYRVRDAPLSAERHVIPRVVDKKGSYLPRCLTRISKRTELYSSRSDEFWLSLRFEVEEKDERTSYQKISQNPRYSIHGSYFDFHSAFWNVLKTKPCQHPITDPAPLSLDLDTVTVAGLSCLHWTGDAEEARICICLVKGDARARWLMIHYGSNNCNQCGRNKKYRRILLRCDGCCADCSVKTASQMAGDWMVIL